MQHLSTLVEIKTLSNNKRKESISLNTHENKNKKKTERKSKRKKFLSNRNKPVSSHFNDVQNIIIIMLMLSI